MQGANNLSNARHLTYLDFELEIGLGSGREYPVTVVRSPAGEARETLRFPFDELALESGSRICKLRSCALAANAARAQAACFVALWRHSPINLKACLLK